MHIELGRPAIMTRNRVFTECICQTLGRVVGPGMILKLVGVDDTFAVELRWLNGRLSEVDYNK